MPGRKANGAKLPSEGLRLNASKSESRPNLQRYILYPTRGWASLRIPFGVWTGPCVRLGPLGLVLCQSDDHKPCSGFWGTGVDTISNCGMSVRILNRL